MDTTRKLLIVEDNPGDVRLIIEMLHDSDGNMTVEIVDTQAAAIDRLAVADIDLVLLDLGLPDSQGLETFTRLRDAAPGVAIIVFTGNSDVELAVSAVKGGAQNFLVKDRVSAELMTQAISYAIERKQVEKALASSESRLKAMFEQAPVGIALVEPLSGCIREANARFLEITGWSEEDLLARGWEGITHPDDVQQEMLAFSKMGAGEIDGFTMAKRYVRRDDQIAWAILTVSAIKSPDLYLCMVEDITADKAAEDLAAWQTERIKRTLTSVIDIAGNIVEVRDPYTAGHQRRVAELAARLAHELGMSDLEVADIHVAGLLHDVGKAAVPTDILGKPGSISPVEFELIKGHAEAGYRIAVSANMDEPIPELIHQHHERCDGSGYPRGLVGDEILSGAKVLAVADVVEAMMSHRPYRPALGIDAALAEIERGVGRLYDAEVCDACVALFREDHFQWSA